MRFGHINGAKIAIKRVFVTHCLTVPVVAADVETESEKETCDSRKNVEAGAIL